MKHYTDAKECNCCGNCNAFMYRPQLCTCDTQVLMDDSRSDSNEAFHVDWAANGCQLFYGSKFQEKLLGKLGIDITSYFLILRFLFYWIITMIVVGLVFTAASFYTMSEKINPAIPVCKANYSDYYMCPLCDESCDFWYLKRAINENLCTRHFRLVFDNPVIWGFSAIAILSGFIVILMALFYSLKLEMKTELLNQETANNEKVSKRMCGCCCIIWRYIWMVIYIIVIGGLYFGFVLLSLYIEDHRSESMW